MADHVFSSFKKSGHPAVSDRPICLSSSSCNETTSRSSNCSILWDFHGENTRLFCDPSDFCNNFFVSSHKVPALNFHHVSSWYRKAIQVHVLYIYIYTQKLIPRCSMYGIFKYIWVIVGANVDKYAIHGAYGICVYMHKFIIIITCVCQ